MEKASLSLENSSECIESENVFTPLWKVKRQKLYVTRDLTRADSTSSAIVQTGQPESLEGGDEEQKKIRILPNLTRNVNDDFVLSETLIGKGQFGVVKSCVRRTTGALSACKSIKKLGVMQTEQQIEALRTEIAVMEYLTGHQNIVQLHGVYEDNDHVHMLMELCGGGDLFDLITASKMFKEAEAAWIFRRVVSAVAHCHGKGVVHRDIKPENILLRIGPVVEPKLADFGLAALLVDGQHCHGLAGSPFYMAPEVVQGQLYTFPADIWSLGVLLYIMLSGHLPFWGETSFLTFIAVCRGEADFSTGVWPSISPLAKSLVKRMLSVEPSLRPTAQQVLADPWLLNFGPPPAARPSLQHEAPYSHSFENTVPAHISSSVNVAPTGGPPRKVFPTLSVGPMSTAHKHFFREPPILTIPFRASEPEAIGYPAMSPLSLSKARRRRLRGARASRLKHRQLCIKQSRNGVPIASVMSKTTNDDSPSPADSLASELSFEVLDGPLVELPHLDDEVWSDFLR